MAENSTIALTVHTANFTEMQSSVENTIIGQRGFMAYSHSAFNFESYSGLRQDKLLEGANFALLEILSRGELYNSYGGKPSAPSQSKIQVDTVTFDLTSDYVSIICSAYDIRSGYLCAGESSFMNYVGIWEMRKIQTEAPLGKFILN